MKPVFGKDSMGQRSVKLTVEELEEFWGHTRDDWGVGSIEDGEVLSFIETDVESGEYQLCRVDNYGSWQAVDDRYYSGDDVPSETLYVIDWDYPNRAATALQRWYGDGGDWDAMRDAIAAGEMTPRECAEAWIDGYIDQEHWVETEPDSRGDYDNVPAEFTNDRERCVRYYEERIRESIEDDAIALGQWVNRNGEILNETTIKDSRHSAEGGGHEDWRTLKLGRVGDRWYVWINSGGNHDDLVYYAGGSRVDALSRYREEQDGFLDGFTDDGGILPDYYKFEIDDDVTNEMK